MKKDYNFLIDTGLKKLSSEIETVKTLIVDSIDGKLGSMKEWINQMNHIMSMTSLLDQQDEIDRYSLSLIGSKPKAD